MNSYEKTQKYDIIICGGGVSGVCCAIAAGRKGAKVLLVEQTNCLGGTWTAGLVSWMLDTGNKENLIVTEIINALIDNNAGRTARDGNFIFNAEEMKVLLDKMCTDAGVNLRFHSLVTDVNVSGSIVSDVTVVSKCSKEHFSAKYFIDATGDGDLCFLAGAEFDIGNENNMIQPMSMFAVCSGLDRQKLSEFDNSEEYKSDKNPKELLYEEFQKAGFDPSQKIPALYYLHDDIFLLTMNHQYNKRGFVADELTEATVDARREINEGVSALRSTGGIWKDIKVINTASYIGIREGRRIRGKYTLTKNDVLNCRKFSDPICDCSFCIDVHSLTKDDKLGYDASSDDVERHYQIPFESAQCKGFDNLYMTGRCISGDFYAHASYRVSGNAAVIGENVGKRVAGKLKME